MSKNTTNIFLKGLLTGLTLQLAIGPVFFFIVNLALQRSFVDGLAGVFAVTIVDCFYILLSIVGIGKLLESNGIKKPVGIISSSVLMAVGLLMLKSILNTVGLQTLSPSPSDWTSSFFSTFVLTITNPLTITVYTGVFTAKALENNFLKNKLLIFGLGTGLATFIFMGTTITVLSLISEQIPLPLVQLLNGFVGLLLVMYGIKRLIITVKK